MRLSRTFEDYFFSTKEIERTNTLVWARWLKGSSHHPEAPDASGLTLPVFLKGHKSLVGHALKAIHHGDYEPFPAILTKIFADKERPYMRPAWIDRWILAHLGRLYGELSEPRLHSRVFSYRRGVGQHTVLRELSSYVALKKSTYVVRGDISEFGETLDHEAVSHDFHETVEPGSCGRKLFQSLCRYPFTLEGRLANLIRGLPMGSHLQLVAENLYLRSLDERLSHFRDGFYARFGDDIIAAHPELEVAIEMERITREAVAARGLRLNLKKTERLKLCAPSDSCRLIVDVGHMDYRFSTRYLGRDVTHDGRLLLPLEKYRALDTFFSSQLNSITKKLPEELTLDQRARRLCQALRSLLGAVENNSLLGIRALVTEITDARQLAQLDRRLSELVVSRVFNRPFRKSFFRDFPPQRLREFGLESLTHLRRVGRL